jgi:oligosaccharide repeat unit polymerase
MSGSDARTATAPPRSLGRSLLSPFSVLMAIYFVYLSLVYSGMYKYAFLELMNLGTRILGFKPMPFTVALYFYGAVVILCGFVGGLLAARRIEGLDVSGAMRRSAERLAAQWRRVEGWPVFRRYGVAFTLSFVGWLGCFGANVLQDVIGGISLTDIASRWAQSPIIVFFALGQIFFVPALTVASKNRKQFAFSLVLFVVSLGALTTLGARHMPAKLIIATFLAAVYVVKPKYLGRLAIGFLVLLVVALGVVGAISKQGIYGAAASAKLALGLTYSDSASTVSNFDRIVAMTPSTGIYHGGLLRDSILAGIPHVLYAGDKPDYANYQLGRYLGGRKYFVINDQRIDRSVSLAPTMLGAAYADWGVPGVIVQMLLLGVIFGYMQARVDAARWLIPFLVTFAAYAVHAVNVGVHNPHAIVAIVLAVLVMLIDMTVGRALAPAKPLAV